MSQSQLNETQIRAGVSVTDQTTPYTLALTDNGTCVSTDRNITIPANSSIAFRKGSMVTIYNANTTDNVTIAITSDTLRVAGKSNTGTQNLVPYGIATLFKVGSTTWVASGPGYADV
jgi:ABC-type molybdate transport system substrate-binding protein